MSDWQELARAKAAASGEAADQPADQLASQWLRVIQVTRDSFNYSDMSDQSLEHLLQASRDLQQFQTVARALYVFAKSQPPGRSVFNQLIEHVDKSPFALNAWLQGIEKLLSWLADNNKRAEFSDILGYLQCCAVSPSYSGSSKDLPRLVDEMLVQHGFERSKNS